MKADFTAVFERVEATMPEHPGYADSLAAVAARSLAGDDRAHGWACAVEAASWCPERWGWLPAAIATEVGNA